MWPPVTSLAGSFAVADPAGILSWPNIASALNVSFGLNEYRASAYTNLRSLVGLTIPDPTGPYWEARLAKNAETPASSLGLLYRTPPATPNRLPAGPAIVRCWG